MSFECAVKPPVVPSLVQEEMVALGTVLIGAITVIFALVLQSFLDTSGDEVLRQSINVIKEDPAIEVYLKKFRKPSLKKDYKGYKGIISTIELKYLQRLFLFVSPLQDIVTGFSLMPCIY